MNPEASSLEVLESRYDQVLDDLDVLLATIESTIHAAKPPSGTQSPSSSSGDAVS